MRDFRKLDVWHKSHLLTLDIYRVSAEFPRHEVYGLTIQLRRSASSVGSNIAEGCGRNSDRDFARFLDLAMGSACEAEYQLLLGKDLEYIAADRYRNLDERMTEVKRMLAGLLRRLRPSPQSDDNPSTAPPASLDPPHES
ncbi:MAG: four helix bundle protein [Planctomycetaceae bacterium]